MADPADRTHRHGRVPGCAACRFLRDTRAHCGGTHRCQAHATAVGCTLERAWEPATLRNALNATLPADIAVRDVAVREASFDARRDAVERTYRYVIVCRDGRAPVLRRNAWTVRGPLDIDAMRSAARALIGQHDFAAFGSAPRAGGSTVRNVATVNIERNEIGR